MTKPTKILIFLLFIFLILILYLILTSASVKKNDNVDQPAKNQASALSDEDYKMKAKEIFIAYEELAQDNSFTTEKIAALKDRLLAVKGLPAGFKELHLNFVSAMDRMEDYLREKDQPARDTSQKITNQLKADYSWLNN